MWVLLFLLSLLATLKDRRKMTLVAATFVGASGLVYFSFMAAWLNMFFFVGLSRTVQVILGFVAGIIGGINIKDFFAFRQGVSLSIPAFAKPGIYAKVRRIVQAEALSPALIGVAALAVTINMVELLCTAGFPAVYTQILALHRLSAWQYYGYLALYNLAYIADDALMVTIAVLTLGRRKLQEREGRRLKLISGIVMLVLGLLLILKPKWLGA
jgi:cytochrome c biogenesis protein CcdA